MFHPGGQPVLRSHRPESTIRAGDTGITVVNMPPRSPRLTVAQFLREVFDHRTPLLYAVAVVAGSTRAGDTYQAGSTIPQALLVGSVVGLGLFVLLCAIVWFSMRIRGM
jgi:hypothetical protein